MKKRVFLLGSVLSITFLLRAFPVVHMDCKQDIEKAFQAEKDFIKDVFDHDQCWFLSYLMVTEVKSPVSGKFEKIQTNGELWATKEIRLVKTDKTETLMDGKDVFTVISTQKKVIRTRTAKDFFKNNDNVYNTILKDSMMKQYTIVSCSPVVERPGDTFMQYILVPLHRTKALYSKMVFSVTPRSLVFKKMYFEINPALASEARSYTMIVKERSKRVPDKNWSHISSKYLDSKGKLLKQYSGYEYKDLTQKK